MNINSLNTNQITQLTSSTLDSAPAIEAASSNNTEAAHTNMSGPGQLMSKLTQLKQSDPAKFKEVVSNMAASLKDAASQHTGKAAERLNQLASKLDDVANGGDIAQLQPSGPPPGGAQGAGGHHGHHGHHAHGGGGSKDAGDTSDGTGVSAARPPDGAPPADAAAGSEAADAAQKYGENSAASEHDSFRQTLASVFGQLDQALSNSAAS